MKFLSIIILFVVSISLFLQTKRNTKVEKEMDRRLIIIQRNILKIDSLKKKGLVIDNRIDSLNGVIYKIEKKEAR